MLVIRHGKIAYERTYKHDYSNIYRQEARTPGPLNAHDPSSPYNYFNPWWHPYYRRGDLHTMQSVTKSITSVVIGIAAARREFPSLDTPVLTFFDAAKVDNIDDRKHRMTLRHVLTMTTGLDWDEDLPYADPNNASSLMEASSSRTESRVPNPESRIPNPESRGSRHRAGVQPVHVAFVQEARAAIAQPVRNGFSVCRANELRLIDRDNAVGLFSRLKA